MTATSITVNAITATGTTSVTPVAADTANGNICVNDGLDTFIEVTNSDTAVHHITFQPTRTVAGFSVTATPIAIPASQSAPIKFGPFSARDYSSGLEFTADSAMIKVAAYSV
jgi:hypothetical protein